MLTLQNYFKLTPQSTIEKPGFNTTKCKIGGWALSEGTFTAYILRLLMNTYHKMNITNVLKKKITRNFRAQAPKMAFELNLDIQYTGSQ